MKKIILTITFLGIIISNTQAQYEIGANYSTTLFHIPNKNNNISLNENFSIWNWCYINFSTVY